MNVMGNLNQFIIFFEGPRSLTFYANKGDLKGSYSG